MYFLDSNSCIYFLNGKYGNLRTKILQTSPAAIKIPSVVKAELLLGAEKSQSRDRTLARLERFLEPFEIMPFDDQVSYRYAKIRYQTESTGRVVGPNDLLIAAIVVFHEGILITKNTREFSAIEGLRLEDWTI